MQIMSKVEFEEKIKSFNFKECFNYFGWDNDIVSFPPIEIDDDIYLIKSVAQKRGFRIVECYPMANSAIPDRSIRNRIESKFSLVSHDHIIIFTDANRKRQVWQFAYRALGQNTKRVEIDYDIRMNPEKIYERAASLVFGLDEEDKLTIIDVVDRVRNSMTINAEKVTKKFYDHFKTQRKAMVDSIVGIDNVSDKEWYASIMINRLMFCYFIQKRRFLNNDMDYLNNKLKECKKKEIDGFYSFYKNFLMVLFHDGLSSTSRNKDIITTIGNVPYLNGGLFEVHSLEKKYPNISISDDAFEKLFAFFDKWDWHLDSSSYSSTATEINPDILGYIFEKYTNDRAKLGAYYTKEDITDYMTKNSILPSILKNTQKSYPIAFENGGSFWTFLNKSQDTYIYDSIKYGMNHVERCFDSSVSLSVQAPKEINIGKETWRDVLDRRRTYIELKKKIEQGQVTGIDDLVTCNIDICSLIFDFINTTDDYGFLYAFYAAIKEITVIDPSCGSGAFLLAALNVLEPLYECCLSRLEYVVSNGILAGMSHAYIVDDITSYTKETNKTYWIQKHIASDNLFGVDIISEASETSKLRLFLKLMASVEPDYSLPNMGIEPLPDMDYNIRTGNSLVGFTSFQDIYSSFEKNSIEERKSIIQDLTIKFADLNKLMSYYKRIQFAEPENVTKRTTIKEEINLLIHTINNVLDMSLYKKGFTQQFEEWKKAYKPFHWYVEFITIVKDRDGFDVVVGNPPYVKNIEIQSTYNISDYETFSCGNVYTCFVERASFISNSKSSLAYILQLPIVCTDGMEPARKYIFEHYNMIAAATFDDRPGKLFDELQHIRVAIIIANKNSDKSLYTTSFNRWYSETRNTLFQRIQYYKNIDPKVEGSIAKTGDARLDNVLKKLNSYPRTFSDVNVKTSKYQAYYHNAPLYWIRGCTKPPFFWNEREGEKPSSQYKGYCVSDKKSLILLLSVLNSSLFYVWFVVYGDMRHLNRREIDSFPVCDIDKETQTRLEIVLAQLMEDYEKNKTLKECLYPKTTGLVKYDEYHPKHSKDFMDKIDNELAKCYGLTMEELEYIINYDIKYRMGGSDVESDE